MIDNLNKIEKLNSASIKSIEKSDVITEEDRENISFMLKKLAEKRNINLKRLGYYKSSTPFKDLAISTPTKLKNKLHYALGLGKIVVDKITNPVSFVEIATDNQDLNAKLAELTRANGYKEIVRKLFNSLAIFGCSFLSVTKGDLSENEPEILLLPLTPLTATGILNQRTGVLDYGLSIIKMDEKDDNNPVAQMIYYRKNDYVIFDKVKDDHYEYTCIENPFNECSLHLVANNPTIFQPFGKSLLTDSIMDAIDSSVGAIIRATISAEVSTLPQRYIAGNIDTTDKKASEKFEKLENKLGGLWTFDLEEGEKLQIGQLEGSDFQAQLRQLSFFAHLISNETSIPASELGFLDTTLANPQSAESILAGRQALIERINNIIEGITPQLNKVISNIASYFNIETKLIEHRFSGEYKQTFLLQGSEVLRKLATAMPNIVETDFVAQILGMTQKEWTTTKSQMKNASLQQGLDALLGKIGTSSNTEPAPSNDEKNEEE